MGAGGPEKGLNAASCEFSWGGIRHHLTLYCELLLTILCIPPVAAPAAEDFHSYWFATLIFSYRRNILLFF